MESLFVDQYREYRKWKEDMDSEGWYEDESGIRYNVVKVIGNHKFFITKNEKGVEVAGGFTTGTRLSYYKLEGCDSFEWPHPQKIEFPDGILDKYTFCARNPDYKILFFTEKPKFWYKYMQWAYLDETIGEELYGVKLDWVPEIRYELSIFERV